jgi:ABC-type glycerol-3-phosphate transport system permease component
MNVAPPNQLQVHYRKQRRTFFVLGLALVGIFAASSIVCWVNQPTLSAATGAVAIACSFLLRYFAKRFPKQLPESALVSGTPPAGQEPRHR